MNPFKTVGICGIGQMGASAAVAFQRAGYRVLLWARDRDKLRAVEAPLCSLEKWSDEHVGAAMRAGGEIQLEPELARLDTEADAVLECIIENMDLVGLDAVERIHTYLLPDLARNTEPALGLSAKVRAGDLGMKSGRGYYDWSRRDPTRVLADRDRQIARQLAFVREIGER